MAAVARAQRRLFGIALDEHTKFSMENSSIVEIVGVSTAYFSSRPARVWTGHHLTHLTD
jgi:cyanophycinase-like exopeptidase